MSRHALLHNIPVFPKLLILVAIIIVTMIFTIVFGTFFAIPIWGSNVLDQLSSTELASNPSTIVIAKYFQIVSQMGMFIFPVLIFSFLDGRNISSYLKLNVGANFIVFVVAVTAILFATPLINFLAEVNNQMKLPSAFSGMEQWMRNSEDQAGQITTAFLNVSTLQGFLLNLFMIAIIPAIGEEFLFRGVLQPLFHKWTKNIHVGILISAFLFSAIHMQFYGFIPRFLMGVLLGYAFAWTGSIWIPVIIHFTNNGAAVILSYFYLNGEIGNEYETMGTGSSSAPSLAISIFVTALSIILLYCFARKSVKDKIAETDILKSSRISE